MWLLQLVPFVVCSQTVRKKKCRKEKSESKEVSFLLLLALSSLNSPLLVFLYYKYFVCLFVRGNFFIFYSFVCSDEEGDYGRGWATMHIVTCRVLTHKAGPTHLSNDRFLCWDPRGQRPHPCEM